MPPFKTVNAALPLPDPIPKKFSLSARPGTDIYASPSHGYVWTAPIYHTIIRTSKFVRAKVTLSFTWESSYDQAGLIIAFPSMKQPHPSAGNSATKETHPQWVKAGFEVNEGRVWASCVARETWADWSLSLPPTSMSQPGQVAKTVRAVVEFERRKNALYVFVSAADGTERMMIREPQWVFTEERNDVEAWLGVYTCAPDPNGEREGRELEVMFEDFLIEEV